MEPINILTIFHEKRNEKCVFCLQVHGSCKCCQPNCENWFHVTCAQKRNCLMENTNPKNNKIVFQAYCNIHKSIAMGRRISSAFVKENSLEKSHDHEPSQRDQTGAVVNYDIIGTVSISSSFQGSNVTSNSNEDIVSLNDASNASDVEDGPDSGETTNIEPIDSPKNNESGPSNIGNDARNSTCVSRSKNIDREAAIVNIFGTSVATINDSIHNDFDGGRSDNRFWWDYFGREGELEARLRSQDEKISKVKYIFYDEFTIFI